MEGFWSNVPVEIIGRVMSRLPVPDLCACRAVCKTWNELLRKTEFVDQVCDLNGRKEATYLFVTGHVNSRESCWVDDAYRRTTCFLDLDKRRWFSIPIDATLLAPTDENVPRLLAMDDGLVCEFSALAPTYEEYKLVMFDPVANTRRELPAITYDDGRHGPVLRLEGGALPAIATSVDNAACSFKVFLINRRKMVQYSGYFVYESSIDAWRDLGNPLEELGVRVTERDRRVLRESRDFAETAVFFQGNLYATCHVLAGKSTILLLSYNLQENLWREVLMVESESPGYHQLIVTGNRMFMAMWLYEPCRPWSLQESSARCVDHPKRPTFEIREILVNEINSSKLVVQIPYADLKQMFYGEEHEFGLQYDIALGFPIDSNSVVLLSRLTGKLVTYDVRSGCVGALPAHPLRQSSLELIQGKMLSLRFRARLMNLSLRNILSRGPVTSGSHA